MFNFTSVIYQKCNLPKSNCVLPGWYRNTLPDTLDIINLTVVFYRVYLLFCAINYSVNAGLVLFLFLFFLGILGSCVQQQIISLVISSYPLLVFERNDIFCLKREVLW